MAFPSPARVGLFGISACLEAPSEKDQDEVEEATTEALSGCVCVCVSVARQEHQTNFEELEGLIAMVSCLHEAVLPAVHVWRPPQKRIRMRWKRRRPRHFQ